MKILDLIKQANHNAWSRKTRSILTILSIVVGATTLTLAVGLGNGAQNIIQENLNNAEMRPNVISVVKFPEEFLRATKSAEQEKGVPKFDSNNSQARSQSGEGFSSTPLFINQSETEVLASLDEVETVYPLYKPPALNLQLDGKKYQANVLPAEPGTIYKPIQGKAITDEQPGILLSETYSQSLGITPDQLVGKQVKVTFVGKSEGKQVVKDLPVVGVMADPYDNYPSYATYSVLKDVAKTLNQTQPTEAILELKNQNPKNDEILALSKRIESLNSQYSATSQAQSDSETKNIIQIVKIGLIAFAAIVLIAAVFGIANTLLMSVIERTKDIGLMKALGMKRGQVFKLFAFEASVIGFWGGVIGILIGLGLGELGNKLTASNNVKLGGDVNLFEFELPSLLIILVILILIAFLAGSLPARKASKTNIVDALRYE